MYNAITVFTETIGQVTFLVEVDWCDFEPGFDDARDIDFVRKGMESGNIYAWCTVFVSAFFGGVQGGASICGCSYESLEDLMGDLYQELQADALRDLEDNIQRTKAALDSYVPSPEFDSVRNF